MLGAKQSIIEEGQKELIDPFGRKISFLRVSLTDRCDFRCVYCMAEHMTFLPKAEVLSLEEIEKLCSAFINLGTKKNKTNWRRTSSQKECAYSHRKIR